MSDIQIEAATAKSNPEAYVTGGTVQASGGLYVKRDADDELLMLCRMRAFVYILSTRQVGKSSLMTNVAQLLAEEGTLSVIVDLSELGGTREVTADQWYVGVLKELRSQLGLRVDVKPWWDAHAHLPYGQRLTLFLREVLLRQIEAPVVIFIDEIDTTRSLAFTDDFYSAVRSVYNARARISEFQRLSFVLVGVATPTDLIRDPKRTPFNIGQRVEITDFKYDEALSLTDELGLPPAEAEIVLRRVLKWTSGHPNLTLRLLRVIADRTLEGKTDWSEEDVDRLVDETFFGNEEVDNLSFVRDMLTIHAPDKEAVLTTYRDILRHKSVPDEEHSVVKSHLKLSGVVRRERGTLHIRNDIYRRAFDEAWVKDHMPANWPRRLQRAALAAVVLFLIALLPLSIFAFYQRSLAFSALEQAKQQKTEAERQEAIAKDQRGIAEGERGRAVSALEDAQRERERATKAAGEASAAAKAAESAKARAEKAAEAARLATAAERSAKMVAIQQTQLAQEAAARATQEKERADLERKKADDAAAQEKIAADDAQKARDEALKAKNEEIEQRKLAEARGQVGFARQLEIQAERELDKSDTSAAEVYFANALEFDDRMETRGRVLTAMLRGSEKLWVSPTQTENQNVAVSGDGRTLAFVDDNRVIRLRDIEQGTEINHIPAQGNIAGLALAPDGSRLVTVETDDRTENPDFNAKPKVLVYDSKTGAKSPIDIGSVAYARNMLFSRDANVIVINDLVVDVSSRKVSRLTRPNPNSSFYGEISPDGRLMAEEDHYSITIFRLDSGQAVKTIAPAEAAAQSAKQTQAGSVTPHTYEFINTVRFSPDGRRLAAAVNYTSMQSDAVIVWDVESGREVTRLPLPNKLADLSLAFGPDGRTLAVWDDLKLENWDLDSHALLNSYSLQDVTGAPTPTFSPDGRLMVLRTNPITLSILDVRTGAKGRSYSLGPIEGHAAEVNSVAFSLDGKLLASGSKDISVIVWDAESGKLLWALWGHASGVNSVAFSPADRRLLASGGGDGAVFLWNAETGERVGKLVRPPLPPQPTPTPTPRPPTPTPTPKASAARSLGGAVAVIGEGVGPGPSLGHDPSVNSVAFSPDGKLLATGGSDRSIRLWDVGKREMVGEFCAGSGVNSVTFNPAGSLIASGSTDGVVRLLEVGNLKGAAGTCNLNYGKAPRELKAHKGSVLSVAFSPDGRMLASTGADKLLKLWGVEGGTQLNTLSDQATYGSAVFNPDGTRLVVASSEGRSSGDVIHVWDLSSGKLSTIIRNRTSSETIYSKAVTAIAFSPDGTLLATGRTDKEVRLWRFPPNPTQNFARSGPSGTSAIDPTGRLLAYASQTGSTPEAAGFIVIQDIGTAQMIRRLSAPQFGNLAWGYLVFSPDAKMLASIGTPRKTAGAAGQVTAPDVPDFSTVVIWDVASGRVLASSASDFNNHFIIPQSPAAFSFDGRWFALCVGGRPDSTPDVVGGEDGRLKEKAADQKAVLLDIKSGQLRSIAFDAGTLWSVAFSPDGTSLILGGGASRPSTPGRKTLQIYNLVSGEKVTREVGLGGAVLGLAFKAADSAGGQLLAISSGNASVNNKDQTFKLVNFPSLEPLPLFQQFTELVTSTAFVPGGASEQLVVTLSNGVIRLWDLNVKPSDEHDGLVLNDNAGTLNSLTFGTDGRRLLIVSPHTPLTLFDLALPKYLMKASARDILQMTQRRTDLHVTGLDKMDSPILSQQELRQRLKDKYDFSFNLLPLPENPTNQ